jgi:hypothetical protein
MLFRVRLRRVCRYIHNSVAKANSIVATALSFGAKLKFTFGAFSVLP